jgi:prepilin-type processing-associated H-X9-DG protein
MICPSFRGNLEEDMTATSKGGGYGYNIYGVGSTYYVNGEKYGVSMKASQFTRPSSTVAFGDAANGGMMSSPSGLESYYLLYPHTSYAYNHFRHNEKTNIAWVDGHVDSQEASEIGTTDICAEYVIGWVGPEADDDTYYKPFND